MALDLSVQCPQCGLANEEAISTCTRCGAWLVFDSPGNKAPRPKRTVRRSAPVAGRPRTEVKDPTRRGVRRAPVKPTPKAAIPKDELTSPWSKKRGGALSQAGALPELDFLKTLPKSAPSPSSKKNEIPLVKDLTDTEQVPIEDLAGKARSSPPRASRQSRIQAWDEVIAKASPEALEKWGTTREAEAETRVGLKAHEEAQARAQAENKPVPKSSREPEPRWPTSDQTAVGVTTEEAEAYEARKSQPPKPLPKGWTQRDERADTLRRAKKAKRASQGPEPKIQNAPVVLGSGGSSAPKKDPIPTAGLDLTPTQAPSDSSGTMPGPLDEFTGSDLGLDTRMADGDEMAGGPSSSPPPKKTKPRRPRPSADRDPTPIITNDLILGEPDPEPLVGELDAEVGLPEPADSTEPQADVTFTAAGGLRSAAALAIDTAVLVVFVHFALVFGAFGERVGGLLDMSLDAVAFAFFDGHLVIFVGGLLVLWAVCSAGFHGLAGASPGKLVMGIRVIRRKDGGTPGLLRTSIRALFAVVGLVLGGAGYFWLIVDREGRAFHDLLTGLTVVRRAT